MVITEEELKRQVERIEGFKEGYVTCLNWIYSKSQETINVTSTETDKGNTANTEAK